MHTTFGPQPSLAGHQLRQSSSQSTSTRPHTALHATAAPPSRYAAEETARKAAAVREQLKHHSSKYARQIHEQNVHIAELQQQAARRAQQQADLNRLAGVPEQQQLWGEEDGPGQDQQQDILEQVTDQQHQQQQLSPTAETDAQQHLLHGSTRPQQQRRGKEQQQHRLFQAAQQDDQHHHHQQQQHEGFPRLLQEVEVLARSSDYRDWQRAARQCRCVLVPAVSGPLQAAAAWRLMVGLAGRQLSRHSQGALGGAAAALVQVSLANADVSMLQRLLASSNRFLVGPRQLRDLASVAAAAGADTDMLTALLDLAPACQLSSRAYFVVAATAINRRHYQEAAACLAKLQDRGVGLSPGLLRLQQTARGALRAASKAAAR